MADTTYPCSQSALYASLRLLWASVLQEIAAFAIFSASYDNALITQRLQEIEDAEALPEEQQRNAVIERMRIELIALLDQGLDTWQLLKRYIERAYASEIEKPMLEEAGSTYYEAAGNENWDKARELFKLGIRFITNHTAELTANNNMPATFLAQFTTAQGLYNSKMDAFYLARQNKPTATQTKIFANNDIYGNGIEGGKDGQRIFIDDEALRNKFVFDSILLIVNGAGISGIRGFVKDIITNLPLEGVIVTNKNTGQSTRTDANGRYELSPIAAGSILVTYELEDYNPEELAVDVETGHLTSKSIVMTKTV